MTAAPAVMHPAPQLAPGAALAGGEFRLVRQVAHGGMGTVYLAEQASTGRARAVKVLRGELLADPAIRTRFVREALVAAQIDSDHVVDVIAAGVEPGTGLPWLAMEWLHGEDLGALVARRGRLSPAEVALLFTQLGHALAAAHAAGVVHRDLKPANVFVARARRPDVAFTVKLLDFGIARLVQDASARAMSAASGAGADASTGPAPTTTAPLGTPAWMAPEQLRLAPAGPWTDVWALGLLAFYTLAGRAYWLAGGATTGSAGGVEAVLAEKLFGPLPPASERAAAMGVAGAIPPGFDAWFARCVVRDPAARFADARAACAALASVLAPYASGAQPATAQGQWVARPGEGAPTARSAAARVARAAVLTGLVLAVLGTGVMGLAIRFDHAERRHTAVGGGAAAAIVTSVLPDGGSGETSAGNAGEDPAARARRERAELAQLTTRLRGAAVDQQAYWLTNAPVPTDRDVLIEAGLECIPYLQDGHGDVASESAARRLGAIDERLAVVGDAAAARAHERFRARLARYDEAYQRLSVVSLVVVFVALLLVGLVLGGVLLGLREWRRKLRAATPRW